MRTSELEIRRLEASEYGLLAAFPDKATPNPENSIVLVAKDGDQLAGRIVLIAPAHIEAPWVMEKWRGQGLFKRLMAAMEREAKAQGIKALNAYTLASEAKWHLERLGFSVLPITVWTKEI